MGLAFWRVYHEQQQEKAAVAAQKKPLSEISPLHALRPEEKRPQESPEQPPASESKPEGVQSASRSHSRAARAARAQAD